LGDRREEKGGKRREMRRREEKRKKIQDALFYIKFITTVSQISIK
jgi:hypothetical protein